MEKQLEIGLKEVDTSKVDDSAYEPIWVLSEPGKKHRPEKEFY